jgi:hypothetical protein
VKSGEPGSFLAFKEIADKSLGLRDEDGVELVPLESVLARIEDLCLREVSRFDTAVELIQRDELYFRDLGVALDSFRRHMAQTFARVKGCNAPMCPCCRGGFHRPCHIGSPHRVNLPISISAGRGRRETR